jgi:hypothetical protein
MQVTTIGLDLAKSVFQVHGIAKDDTLVFNRPLRRAQVLGSLQSWGLASSAWNLAAPPIIGRANLAPWAMTCG